MMEISSQARSDGARRRAAGPDKTRVLLADDHELVRETLALLLKSQDEFEVVTTADFPSAAEEVAEATDMYDVILLDWQMPGMEGMTSLKRMQTVAGGSAVAILSGTASAAIAEQVLMDGADGFLPKTLPASAFIAAVRLLASGERFLPDPIPHASNPAGNEAAPRLTQREAEVLRGLIAGLANKEIANGLGLSEVTVKLHVRAVCRKLDARNRTAAALKGRELGYS